MNFKSSWVAQGCNDVKKPAIKGLRWAIREGTGACILVLLICSKWSLSLQNELAMSKLPLECALTPSNTCVMRVLRIKLRLAQFCGTKKSGFCEYLSLNTKFSKLPQWILKIASPAKFGEGECI